MSALQIDTHPTDAATTSSAPHSYDLVDLRAGVLADRGTTIAVRAALGILAAVAAMIVIAGVATQSRVRDDRRRCERGSRRRHAALVRRDARRIAEPLNADPPI